MSSEETPQDREEKNRKEAAAKKAKADKAAEAKKAKQEKLAKEPAHPQSTVRIPGQGKAKGKKKK